jgi:hypothetical protein
VRRARLGADEGRQWSVKCQWLWELSSRSRGSQRDSVEMDKNNKNDAEEQKLGSQGVRRARSGWDSTPRSDGLTTTSRQQGQGQDQEQDMATRHLRVWRVGRKRSW